MRHVSFQVAQKTGNAGNMQDAAQGLAPCLEAAEASRAKWPAATGPVLTEDQAGRHKPCAIGTH